MVFVEVRDLTKVYKTNHGVGVRALSEVNITMEKGEFLGLIGESGSGKTTLIRILRGVEKFDHGLVRIGDVVVTPSSPPDEYDKLMRKTAIHLQRSFGLWPETVLENVIRALRWTYTGIETLPPPGSGEYEKLADEALQILDLVGLKDRANLWAIALSGGEKQRLILARQIAKKPEVLLLDEPATMTCPKTRNEVIKTLKKINDLGVTMIMASHMPEMHRKLCDRVVWLDKGVVVGEGDPNDILAKFLSRLEEVVPKPPRPKRTRPILMAKKVTKRYRIVPFGEVFTLKGANLEFKRGEITALLGPSGSGKTVILRLIAGLELPTSGEVLVKCNRRWIDITKLGKESMRARQEIGILHQEFALPYWAKVIDLFAARLGLKSWDMIQKAIERAKELGIDIKVLDALHRIAELPEEEAKAKLEELGFTTDIIKELFPVLPAELVKNRVKEVLKALKLSEDVLYRRSHELSGGEQIRVALALALTSKPSILLLDEPFGDLDPITSRSAANAIKSIVSSLGILVLLVDHQLKFVEETCHKGVVIDDGVILYKGPIKASLRFYKKNILKKKNERRGIF